MRRFQEPLLLLATTNVGKRALIADQLDRLGVPYATPDTHPIPDVEETGATFFDNALLKAKACATATGLVALADDSGLEIPSLGGIPGVHTGRFARDAGGYDACFVKLENMLEGKDTTAIFTSHLVIAWPDGHFEHAKGTIEGRLVFPPRPGRGFGYFPIFAPKGSDKTFSQMEDDEILAYNHRYLAFQGLREVFTAP
ncbi:MAG: non-canonical purine NTP pyrophosphatase [Proteobacteria bacterium]|nr:non-canonical purine NTP pyrophosphatase [Pseudomonadota bacterium]